VKTLVVAPHPDDEILGCGGTLLRRKAEGAQLAWLLVTSVSEQAGFEAQRVAEREAELAKVAAAIGFDECFNLRLPPARLDEVPLGELVGKISDVFRTWQPEEILVPHFADAHSDHRVTFGAVAACTKWFRYPSVRRVLAYETPSETDFGLGGSEPFRPNVFVDISAHLARKLEILQIYRSELGEFPFPRSLEALRALAMVRGSTAGFAAAEAFQLLRERL